MINGDYFGLPENEGMEREQDSILLSFAIRLLVECN